MRVQITGTAADVEATVAALRTALTIRAVYRRYLTQPGRVDHVRVFVRAEPEPGEGLTRLLHEATAEERN